MLKSPCLVVGRKLQRLAQLASGVPMNQSAVSTSTHPLKSKWAEPKAAKYFWGRLAIFQGNSERRRLIFLAFWTCVLIWVSATGLFFLEYPTFQRKVAEHLLSLKRAEQFVNQNDPLTEPKELSVKIADDIKIEDIDIFSTYFYTIWWSVTTFTTVGYGDISPKSTYGKAFGILVMMVGFAWTIILSGSVASILVAQRLKEDKDSSDETIFTDHTIISGWNSMVSQILSVLAQGQGAKPIVLVNETPFDDAGIQSAVSAFDNLDILHIFGNYTHESALSNAFIQRARDMIVVPDYSNLSQLETPDEQTTVLAVYTAKSMSENIRVIAHITDPEMANHLQRASCDEIVISDAFTPKLLAYHVTHPGSPQLVDTIFSPESQSDLQVRDIPVSLAGEVHERIFQHFKSRMSCLLIGYAIVRPGASLEEQMKSAGSDFMVEMIKEQLEREGIELTSDEKVFIETNPKDDYVTDGKHRAIVLI